MSLSGQASESDREFLDVAALPSVKKNPAMKQALGLLQNVAKSDITVLITGESGVGKEIFARAIHDSSRRQMARLVGLNCASVPATLLEAELFGAEKGAYTGALSRRLGKFELAQGGTLLLDEISEMDMNLQSKLLRVIQEKEMYRIGGEDTVSLDVRLVATTNCDLRDRVGQGHFREDLFYRLNVINLHIPPLRERLEDVPVLASHILSRFNRDNPGRRLSLAIEATEQLCRYSWPGNVRELENILIRTAYLTRDRQISRICFDEERGLGGDARGAHAFQGTLDEMERMMIRQALEIHDGNRVRVSNQLGISVRTLRNKLRLYREEARSEVSVSVHLAEEDPAAVALKRLVND